MKTSKGKKGLGLATETLRRLDRAALEEAAGGAGGVSTIKHVCNGGNLTGGEVISEATCRGPVCAPKFKPNG